MPIRLEKFVAGLLAVGMVAGSDGAAAATIEQLAVHRDGEAYKVSAQLVVDVPRKAAYRAATSFEVLAKHSDLIRSSRIVAPHRLDSKLSMCVLFYCKTIHQVMDYRLGAPEAIDMQVVPGAGDLKSGEAHWRFVPRPDRHTALSFQARIVPSFWVPPMIGDWAIARALRKQIADTGRAIERLAEQRQASHPVTPDSSD